MTWAPESLVTSSGNTKECDTVTVIEDARREYRLAMDDEKMAQNLRHYSNTRKLAEALIEERRIFYKMHKEEIAAYNLRFYEYIKRRAAECGHRYQTAVCEGLKIERKQKMLNASAGRKKKER
jgi:hypothetical protein